MGSPTRSSLTSGRRRTRTGAMAPQGRNGLKCGLLSPLLTYTPTACAGDGVRRMVPQPTLALHGAKPIPGQQPELRHAGSCVSSPGGDQDGQDHSHAKGHWVPKTRYTQHGTQGQVPTPAKTPGCRQSRQVGTGTMGYQPVTSSTRLQS